MISQFNMIDSNAPQRLRISWSMETPRDDSAGRPDTMQDGFWPSMDSDNPGYIGGPEQGESRTQYEARHKRAYRSAQGVMSAWKADKWRYVGVVAKAVVFIPAGGRSFRVIEIKSAGLWGIESNAGKYLREVYEERKAGLMAELQDFAAAPVAGDFDNEESE